MRIADRLLNCLGVEVLMAAGGWPDEVLAKITPKMTSLPGFETVLISDRVRLDQVIHTDAFFTESPS